MWWEGGGQGNVEMSVQLMGEMGKDFRPNFPYLFLKTMSTGAVTREAGNLIQYVNPHRKYRSCSLVVARTLEYLVWVPSEAASNGRDRKYKKNLQI